MNDNKKPAGFSEEKATIEVCSAKKKFRENEVLKNVDLKCNKGEICGIIGRNGSGKTVLFKAICGFLNLEEGCIRVNGKEMGKEIDMLDYAGIIIEEPAFLRNQSGLKNLDFLYMIRNRRDKKQLCDVMKRVGLDPLSRKRVGNYSMGMRQRLAIAQAIMENQEILILDEPMNGLDNEGVADIRCLLQDLKKEGKTILIASHNKEDIEVLCDIVYEMDGGELKKIR